MASTPNRNPQIEEGRFKSFSEGLRRISSDNTPLKRNYVSFLSDVYDMLSPDFNSSSSGSTSNIVDMHYDEKTQSILIKRADGTISNFKVEDNFLKDAIYDSSKQNIELTLSNGDNISVNVGELESKFYTKEEVEEIMNLFLIEAKENNELKWGEF